MKLKTYIWIGSLFVLLIVVAWLRMFRPSVTTPNFSTQDWCMDKKCFHLEIADTAEERTQGLMFREELDKDYGMIFVFPDESKHAFWMKNTKIPLDMIRLDSLHTIVDIQEAAPCTQDPCQIYRPLAGAAYVIELKQGTAKSLGMKPGDIFVAR